METMELKAPRTVRGYLGRQEMIAFFSQTCEPREARQRGTKLYGVLVEETTFGRLSLTFRCKRCGRGLHGDTCIPGNRAKKAAHRGNPERREMAVSVASLKEMTVAEFRRTRNTGEKTLEDLELIRRYL